MKGAVIAAAVAGLFMAGPVIAAEEGKSGEAAKVKCIGGNSCKGKGWIMTSESDCKAKGGTVQK